MSVKRRTDAVLCVTHACIPSSGHRAVAGVQRKRRVDVYLAGVIEEIDRLPVRRACLDFQGRTGTVFARPVMHRAVVG